MNSSFSTDTVLTVMKGIYSAYTMFNDPIEPLLYSSVVRRE